MQIILILKDCNSCCVYDLTQQMHNCKQCGDHTEIEYILDRFDEFLFSRCHLTEIFFHSNGNLKFLYHFAGSSNATKCYGNLGCLHLNDDWFGLNRPVNVLPLDRHVINTRFILTTRETGGGSLFQQQPRFLNLSQPLSITTSPFRGNRPTKIIIHGFIDTGFVPWISVM